MDIKSWSVEQAQTSYNIEGWGAGYFGINEKGNVTVRPLQDQGPALDILQVAMEAKKQGMHFPLLLRFQDLLRHRVTAINQSFNQSIQEHGYQGNYRGVFPIKVNHLREVVEEITEAGAPFHFGLEAGSKPELFATLAIHEDRESLIICNGYKDKEFIRVALLGTKLGKKVIMVVEKLDELARIIQISKEVGVEPMIGLRIRLNTKGSGLWATSAGENAKFGLSTSDLVEACEILRQEKLEHCFKLIHFHIGSQITNILTVKRAVREAARYFAKSHKMGFKPEYLDVGGGLGVDYEGNRTFSESSINYNLAEYTRDVVLNIKDVCDEEQVPHPNIISEGGRAVVAHHSVLVVEVFGTIERTKDKFVAAQPDDHKLVIQLSDLIQNLNKRNRTESLHDGLQIKEDAFTRFELGLLDLPTRAKIETNFWHLAEKISKMYAGVKNIPNEVEELNKLLGDQYLCNFSVFQSMVDHWAIGQTFPIIPIHRLNEAPSNEGTLVDITCDSDGKVDDYISCEGLKQSMMLHPFNPDEPYYMGIFLVGAYQDVMGDLHNLFGAVNEAHIFIDEDEEDDFYIEETIKGYSIAEALSDVQYEPSQLARQMKAQVDLAIKQDRLKPNEAMKLLDYYEKGLQKPTYLSWDE